MRLVPHLFRTVALVVVLGLVALTVPDSTVRPAELSLVKLKGADGVDVGDDVIWILAIGSDARPGETMTRTRGDAIQLVGLNTRTGAASAIGNPRDSWVPIPGYGSNRVNAALTFGGPSLMGRTVGNLVGVQPDYVMVTRFPFFENMIN
jgi:anionic cell wall polymer biosynthesis LytR-Cps2A-Psr (LCP) family protein